MSKKSNTQKKDPVIQDVALEEKMKTLAENPAQISAPVEPSTALVPKEDFRVENIRKSNGGERLAVRAASGKFTKLTTAVAASDAKAAQQFLAEKVRNEAGVELSRKQHLREALYSGAIKASQSDKGLGPAVKSFEALNIDAALTQAKERMLVDDSNIQNPIRVVVINCPDNMLNKDVIDLDKKPIEKKQPSFAEVLHVQTNEPVRG